MKSVFKLYMFALIATESVIAGSPQLCLDFYKSEFMTKKQVSLKQILIRMGGGDATIDNASVLVTKGVSTCKALIVLIYNTNTGATRRYLAHVPPNTSIDVYLPLLTQNEKGYYEVIPGPMSPEIKDFRYYEGLNTTNIKGFERKNLFKTSQVSAGLKMLNNGSYDIYFGFPNLVQIVSD